VPPQNPAPTPPPTRVIRPSTGWRALDLGAVWRHRDLVFFLAWRDIRLRYRQTLLGVAWAVIQPLTTMVVFSIFFGRLAKMPSDGLPYPLFSLCALLPWQLFSYSLSESSNSLVNNKHIITKVYFPRLIVPLASVLAGVMDFAVAFVLLLGMMAYYGTWPGVEALVLPLLLLLALTTALGVGLWLATLNVRYRDVRYTLPFLTQVWLFATPIAYPSSLVAEAYRPLLGLNPMAGVVEGFRWALLGSGEPPNALLLVSCAVAVFLLVSGLYFFRRFERTFADVL
jgi:lipopolysaccharide transport system permease protein